MQFNFDQVPSRRHTNSIKWDFHNEDDQLSPRPEAEALLGDNAILPLGLSDMDFPAPPAVLNALRKAVDHGIFGYTRPDESYYNAIRGWLAQRHSWEVEADWILTTTGTMQSVILAIQTLTAPGDGIIIQPPLFGPIGHAIVNNGRILVKNPLRQNDGRYTMDFADLETKAADPANKMLILCHPHNPVGRVWTVAEVQQLGTICRRHDLILVTDEIHGELCYSWADYRPVSALAPELNDRLVVCTGPSKAFNLPGLRISLAIIPSTALRERFTVGLRDLNELFGFNRLGMLALQAAYEDGGPWLDALRAYLEANYLYLRDFLERELPQIRLTPAEGLYLAWLDCRPLGLSDAVLQQLLTDSARVVLEPGTHYGPEGNGFVRLNLACPRALLAQALARIRRALA